MVPDPMAEGMAALAQFFVRDGTLSDTLTRVAELARGALGADMAGITMLVDGRPATAVFTDGDAPEIDAEQYRTGSGPCLDAWRQQVVQRIDDTTADSDWPDFAAKAAAYGIRSTLSLPLTKTGEPLGALNLYSRQSAGFAGVDMAAAQLWATAASTVLANATAYRDSQTLNESLKAGLTSRATIDHAVGIIMAGGGRSADEAFQLLVRASQRENRKLRDIAAEMVASAEQRQPSKSADPPPRPAAG